MPDTMKYIPVTNLLSHVLIHFTRIFFNLSFELFENPLRLLGMIVLLSG